MSAVPPNLQPCPPGDALCFVTGGAFRLAPWSWTVPPDTVGGEVGAGDYLGAASTLTGVQKPDLSAEFQQGLGDAVLALVGVGLVLIAAWGLAGGPSPKDIVVGSAEAAAA